MGFFLLSDPPDKYAGDDEIATGAGGEDSSYQAWPSSSPLIRPSSEDAKKYLLSIYLFVKKSTVSL